MTNQEVIEFFKNKGATNDFKIVNSPMFVAIDIVDDEFGNKKVVNRSMSVENVPLTTNFSLDQFIETNLTNDTIKCYIYNDCFGGISLNGTQFNPMVFDDNMTFIKYKGVMEDKLVTRRRKLKILMEKMK